MNEAQAISLCLKHRDPSGFEFLVERYQKEAYFHAISFLGNPEDAADACQESFSRAFAKMPLIKSMTDFYPWFYTILRNHCLNMIKRHKTIKSHTQSQVQPETVSSDSNDPRRIISAKQEKLVVWRVLESLNPEFREVLVLKYIQSRSYNDIATLTGIPRGTVMSRLYNARKAFLKTYNSHLKQCSVHS